MKNFFTAVGALFMLTILIAMTAVACGDDRKPAQESQPQFTKVVDFGNGVLYFPYSGEEFGKEFSSWRATHKDWVIIAIAPDDAYAYGTRGYFVIANKDI